MRPDRLTRQNTDAMAENTYWGDEGRGAGATGAAGGVEGTGARVLCPEVVSGELELIRVSRKP
jgi:hypothetical protein